MGQCGSLSTLRWELYQERGGSLFHPYLVQTRLPSDGIFPSWIWWYMAGLLALLGSLGYLALFLVWLAGFVGYCNTTARSTGPFKKFQQTCWTASKEPNSRHRILNFFLAIAHEFIPHPQSSKWLLFLLNIINQFTKESPLPPTLPPPNDPELSVLKKDLPRTGRTLHSAPISVKSSIRNGVEIDGSILRRKRRNGGKLWKVGSGCNFDATASRGSSLQSWVQTEGTGALHDI